MSFLKRHHLLVTALLFALAALLNLIGYTTSALGVVLLGVLAEGLAWLKLADRETPEPTSRGRSR